VILQPDFDFIHQPDSIDFDKSISRSMRQLVREHFAKNAYRKLQPDWKVFSLTGSYHSLECGMA
jgi:hypothetical protein